MDANLAVTQLSSATILIFVIQKLKTWDKFPLLKEKGQAWRKRIISIAGALGIHTGITFVWGASTTIQGAHMLSFIIPPWGVIAVGVFHWFNQYLMQEVGYQGYQAVQQIQKIAAMLVPENKS